MNKPNTLEVILKTLVQSTPTPADGVAYAKVIGKGRHFTERFVQRYGNDEVAFTAVVKAFLGMISVRSAYFVKLAAQGQLTEQRYCWKGYDIRFMVERGAPCVGNDKGDNALIKLQTIMPKY